MRKVAFLASLVFLFACSNQSGNSSVDSSKTDTTVRKSTGGDPFKELAESWTASLNLRDASIMKSFYADSVVYYGDHLTADEVVHRQQEYFAQNKDYHQVITEYVDEIQQPDGSWLLKLVKRVTANGKTNDYPASLVFAQVNGGIWKIVAESDDITDLNKASSIQIRYAPEQSTIEGLVEENTTFGDAPGGDPKSDAKTPYYVIWSKSPLDVIATAEQEKSGIMTERNIERVQLIGHEEEIRKLLNRKVKVTGKINHSAGSGQYTKVVMNVELIEETL